MSMSTAPGRIRRLLARYEFPLLLPQVWARVAARLSIGYWTPRTRLSLAIAGCPCGKGLTVDGRVWIVVERRGTIRLGDGVTLKSRFRSNLLGLAGPTVLECSGEGRIAIGDGSGCSSAVLSSRCGITIGRSVMIGGNVRIFDHDYHSLDPRSRREGGAVDIAGSRRRPVAIGDDAFIGVQSIILKGVTIGPRAVIGAGSVVTQDVPADEIWAGNPARRVGRVPGAAPA
jgi:acetyltransferase-like isoleucine patch superfamily enzyme